MVTLAVQQARRTSLAFLRAALAVRPGSGGSFSGPPSDQWGVPRNVGQSHDRREDRRQKKIRDAIGSSTRPNLV